MGGVRPEHPHYLKSGAKLCEVPQVPFHFFDLRGVGFYFGAPGGGRNLIFGTYVGKGVKFVILKFQTHRPIFSPLKNRKTLKTAIFFAIFWIFEVAKIR